MGDSPTLAYFLLNCVNILYYNGQVNVAFASSSIARKLMVEKLYGAPQWEIPEAWFLSFSIVSTYSTTMTKLMFPLLAPQLQEKQWWRCSMVLLNGKFPKLGFFLAQLILSFLLLNVYHAPSNTHTLVMEMLDVKTKFCVIIW